MMKTRVKLLEYLTANRWRHSTGCKDATQESLSPVREDQTIRRFRSA